MFRAPESLLFAGTGTGAAHSLQPEWLPSRTLPEHQGLAGPLAIHLNRGLLISAINKTVYLTQLKKPALGLPICLNLLLCM